MGVDDVHQEQQHTDAQNERADGRNLVPESEVEESFTSASFGPDAHTTWLTLQSKNVHGSECEVHSDHHQPEVPLSETFAQLATEHLGPPVIEAREQAEHCATEQHIVEVGNDVIGVSLLGV